MAILLYGSVGRAHLLRQKVEMPAPDCSIVIVTYNGWELVRKCLQALEPELRTGIDVVVVDNGSVDGVPEKVRSGFKWARVIETGQNLGFAGGNNVGIRQTSGEFVLLLNSDANVRPGFVGNLLESTAVMPRVGSVAAAMVFESDPDLVASAGIDVYANGLALDRSLGSTTSSLIDGLRLFGASAGAALYRREALQDVGLFPDAFFMYLEDVDLAWRLRLRGWESVLSARAVAEHAYSASSGEGSRFKRRLLARNRIWCMTRCYPGWLLRRCWWRMVAYDLTVMASSPIRRDISSVEGRLAAIAGIGPRIAERSEIQACASAGRSEIEPWIRRPPSPHQMLQLRQIASSHAAGTTPESSSCR